MGSEVAEGGMWRVCKATANALESKLDLENFFPQSNGKEEEVVANWGV